MPWLILFSFQQKSISSLSLNYERLFSPLDFQESVAKRKINGNSKPRGRNRLSNFIPRAIRPSRVTAFVRSVKKEREEETTSRRIKKSCLLMARYKSGPVESGYRAATKASPSSLPLSTSGAFKIAREKSLGGG